MISNWKPANVAGTRFARAVCEWCDGESDRVAARPDGRPTDCDLPAGWSCVDYPVDYVHADGSHGSRFTCPACRARGDERQRRGVRPLLSLSPARAAAIRERRAAGLRGSR